ncbi:hypothetical protein [Tunicatimonas pelagia]|uniref:hypothetical protein n=1 Tax=Tunicatimonas pelagia TaxID=931531 RepID=UPI0026651BF3|nr:hypothetical protein [Tunicatimonas pelagia]WKN42892.1 hypothetical protein P0M28_28035 [Tunicatimonas pelagia]
MKLLLIILLLFVYQDILAQRLEERTIIWQPGQDIELDLKYAQNIQIKTWDKPEVSLRISVSINNDELNDAWSLQTTTDEEKVRVTSDLEKPDGYYQGDCSGSDYQMGENSFCSLIVYDIYLPQEATLRVETLGGDITIQGVTAPVYAKSLSGFVDADWPAQQGATVSMKSITGEVYTNLDLAIDESDKRENRRSPIGWEIDATVAGGGKKVELESISNDVYFRRAGS